MKRSAMIFWIGPILFSFPACAGTLTTLYTITAPVDAESPGIQQLVALDGDLFGTTENGGASSSGAVFRVNLAHGTESLAFDFANSDAASPVGLVSENHLLYGTTRYGGSAGGGTLYSLDPRSFIRTELYSFPTPSGPSSPPTAFGSLLYGTAYQGGTLNTGYLYSFDPTTGTETVLHSFGSNGDGAYPSYQMLKVGGLLYGVTENGGKNGEGALFRFDPATGEERVLHSFVGSGGQYPSGQLAVIGSTLYGVTSEGGTSLNGTAFSYDLTSHTFSLLHSFTGGADGGSPLSGLAVAGTLLTGTTFYGGASGVGTVFTIDPTSGTEAVVYSFRGLDGARPDSVPVDVGGVLYGTTSVGGSLDRGTVYALDPANGMETVLHNFTGSPRSSEFGLTRSGGQVYGVSSSGGSNATGSIYAVDVKTGAGRTLYSFPSAGVGINPSGPLLESGGLLYGVTSAGGTAGFGTVFSFDPTTRTLTTLYSFPNQQTGSPSGSLGLLNGLLYGAALGTGSGTLFSLNPVTGQEATVFTFNSTDGSDPAPGVTAANGAIFGAAVGGGQGYGTVYRFDPGPGQQTVLHAFQGMGDGGGPSSALLYANGKLYGTTTGGRRAQATVFAIDAITGSEKVLTHPKTVSLPSGALVLMGNFLYGVAAFGGADGSGALFRERVTGGPVQIVYSFSNGADGQTPAGQVVNIGRSLFGTTATNYDLLLGNAGTVFRYDE